MAKRRPIWIDGQVCEVTPGSTLQDVVSPEVNSVISHEGELIPRSQFTQVPIPDGFDTNLSAINKG